MLVLSRKESERLRLGDSIVLTIIRVSADKVRLGVEAPANVLVLREELQPRTEFDVNNLPGPAGPLDGRP